MNKVPWTKIDPSEIKWSNPKQLRNKIWINGFRKETTQRQIRRLFKRYGNITRCQIVPCKKDKKKIVVYLTYDKLLFDWKQMNVTLNK